MAAYLAASGLQQCPGLAASLPRRHPPFPPLREARSEARADARACLHILRTFARQAFQGPGPSLSIQLAAEPGTVTPLGYLSLRCQRTLRSTRYRVYLSRRSMATRQLPDVCLTNRTTAKRPLEATHRHTIAWSPESSMPRSQRDQASAAATCSGPW